MLFFCAECQCRHPVSDISADLWTIFKDELCSTIQTAPINESTNYALESVRGRLTAFLRAANLSKDFSLSAENVIKNNDSNFTSGESTERCKTGRYSVKFTELVSLFKSRSGEYEGAADDAALDELQTIFCGAYRDQDTLFTKDIQVFLSEVRNADDEKEYMLDYVADSNNGRFAVGNVKLGEVRICPHCGKRVSRAVGRAPEIVVGLAGVQRAGKTSCIVSMISQLNKEFYSDLDISMSVFRDNNWEKFEAEIEKFRNGIKIVKTPADISEVPSESFLIRFGKRQIVLTCVDMPGEFWGDSHGITDDFYTMYSKLYESLDCIWFFVSKLTLQKFDFSIPEGCNESIRKQKEDLQGQSAEDEMSVKAGSASKTEETFTAIRDQLNAKGKKMPPVITIITKPDLYTDEADWSRVAEANLFPVSSDINVANLDDVSAVLEKDDRGRYYLKEEELFRIGYGIRKYLKTVNNSLYDVLKRTCGRCFFISLAAYGRPAVESVLGAGSHPTPFHELFPLLWALAITGNMKILHKVRLIRRNVFGNPKDVSQSIYRLRFDYREYPVEDSGKRKVFADFDSSEYNQILGDISKNLFMNDAEYKTTTINR